MKQYRFIGLFAGLGGFHLALEKFGYECIFTSELQQELQELYYLDHDAKCHGDISQMNIKNDIPSHDIFCAGPPCQPPNKTGKQEGLSGQQNRGNSFYEVMEILGFHKPEYAFSEDVSNLKAHGNYNTCHVIYEKPSSLYDVQDIIISPHYFSIPQHGNCIYTIGRLHSKGGLKGFGLPDYTQRPECHASSIIHPKDTDYIPPRLITRKHLEAWGRFL